MVDDAWTGRKTVLGYQTVEEIQFKDGKWATVVACKPGRPYCTPAYTADAEEQEDEATLLAPAAEGEPGAAELDAIAAEINHFAAPRLHEALMAMRKNTGRTDLAVGARLGIHGFHLVYGSATPDRKVFTIRPLWLRWLRHWFMPWKHD